MGRFEDGLQWPHLLVLMAFYSLLPVKLASRTPLLEFPSNKYIMEKWQNSSSKVRLQSDCLPSVSGTHSLLLAHSEGSQRPWWEFSFRVAHMARNEERLLTAESCPGTWVHFEVNPLHSTDLEVTAVLTVWLKFQERTWVRISQSCAWIYRNYKRGNVCCSKH